MNVLFLGGTGNISAECAALLHGRGHQILVLSRGQSAVPVEYRAVQADRNNPTAMRSALGEVAPEVVINFLGYDLPDVQLDFELFRGRVRQYVFISSATVYAKPPGRLSITENAPLGNPWWEYAQKKLACEQWLLQRWKETGFPVTIVRPSHTYSKRWVPNPVSSSSYSFAKRLEQGKPVFVPDDGQNPWTLTEASDFAVGLGGLVGKPEAIGEVFHITSDEVLTWNQIVEEIVKAVADPSAPSPNSEASAQTDSPRASRSPILQIPTDFICDVAPHLTGMLKGDKAHPGVFDNSKIKRFVPEFQCRKPFRAGVRESITWLRAHPEQQNLSVKVETTIEEVIAAWQRRTINHGSAAPASNRLR